VTPKQLITVMCGALCLTCCAKRQLTSQEVQVPPQRIVQEGYSLIPPVEEGWHVELRNPGKFVTKSDGISPDETLVVEATLVELPKFNTSEEFVQIVRAAEAEAEDPSSERFKVLKHEVHGDSSRPTECALSHKIVEDSAPITKSGKTSSMIMEIMTLACAHPKDKRVCVYVGYTDRYYHGQADPKFLEKAMNVLRSVEFSDFSQ
jgi:hypothetical protein